MPRPLVGVNCDAVPRPSGEMRVGALLCYVQAVEDAGGTPVLLPWQSPASMRRALDRLDGLLLIGGDDLDPALYGARPHPAETRVDPARQAFDLALVREADRRGMPVLGICLGSQLLNVARGGSLVQDIPSLVPGSLTHVKGAWHEVRVEPGSLLSRVLGTRSLEVNSYHHQSVGEPGRGLRVAARAPDGVVEAVEDPGRPFCLAVQWHPERCYREKPRHARLFRSLVKASSTSSGARG